MKSYCDFIKVMDLCKWLHGTFETYKSTLIWVEDILLFNEHKFSLILS